MNVLPVTMHPYAFVSSEPGGLGETFDVIPLNIVLNGQERVRNGNLHAVCHERMDVRGNFHLEMGKSKEGSSLNIHCYSLYTQKKNVKSCNCFGGHLLSVSLAETTSKCCH
jgi:hypothetical protein